MKIFWSGFPGPCGGANVEAWHTAKMLRNRGVDLTFIPTAGADLQMKARLEEIGCHVILGTDGRPIKWDDLGGVPGLKGSVVVSMCNSAFMQNAHLFRDMQCPIVWINCMTFCFPDEIRHYRTWGKTFEAYVFQSKWQMRQVVPKLQPHGYREEGHLIRGAFALDEWPYQPLLHEPGGEFVVGRISRADLDKHSSDTWAIYAKVARALAKECPSRFRVMAWDQRVAKKCGDPNAHGIKADLLPSCKETSGDFVRSLHAMCQVNGGAGENWPRSGLEAMASGTPLVVQNQWGWREMVAHGETGFLIDGDSHEQFAFYLGRLAVDEDLRLRLAENARRQLVEVHADENAIWDGWQQMLERIAK